MTRPGDRGAADGARGRSGRTDVTRILASLDAGDEGSWEQLIAVVHDELRAIAGRLMRSERHEHTFQPTALVNEAFLRLADGGRGSWNDRRHFLAAAAQVMRRVLVDHARRRNSDKRGGTWSRVDVEDVRLESPCGQGIDVLDLHSALKELAALSPRQAQVIELRYFGGMTLEEVAKHLGLTRAQAKGDWTIARAWLFGRLRG